MPAFEKVNKSDWLAKVEKDLKGKPLSELDWKISEDFSVSPFAHQDDRTQMHYPIGIKGNNNWRIGQEFVVDSSNVEAQNAAILAALNNGIESPKIKITEVLSQSDIDSLFKDISVSYVAVYFSGLKNLEDWQQLLKNYALVATQHQIHSDKLFGGFHLDMDWASYSKNDFEEIAEFEELFSSIFPRYRCFYVDGTKYYKGDEHIVEELANITHQVASCMEGLKELGYNVNKIVKKFQVGFSIGNSYLLEIAKVRAMKILFANLGAAIETSPLEIPCFDCYVDKQSFKVGEVESNKIRSTISAMAAVIGAVGRLTIPPSDIDMDTESSEFNKRMSTNIQQVIKLETKMHGTSDPAAGSYYIEELTEQLAVKVWNRFVELHEA